MYSLVTELEGDRYQLHRLIGLWTQGRIRATNAKDTETALRMSLEILSKNFPCGKYENLLECTSLILHVSSVVKHVRQGGIAPLLDSYSPPHLNVGSYMYHKGNYRRPHGLGVPHARMPSTGIGERFPAGSGPWARTTLTH